MRKVSGVNNKGQVTIFIIFAIIIVAGTVLFFTFRGNLGNNRLGKNFQPVYDNYLICLSELSYDGIRILGEQGGYIKVPEFEAGNNFHPTSSHLDFLGQSVPYWLYFSGNNVLKEQIPSKINMESDLEDYLEERIDYCDFSNYEKQGYGVSVDKGGVSVEIQENYVDISFRNDIRIYYGDEKVEIEEHSLKLESKLGKFYELAQKTYLYEKDYLFLEKYARDVLRMYAPVDGFEFNCTPKVFVDEEIRSDLYNALELNMNQLKLKGDYYSLSRDSKKYFIVDVGEEVSENVNFLYDSTWPSRIEIYGEEVAHPIGLNDGLDFLGLCYLPYHLVYDVEFPVLIQFYEEDFLFQFPIAVVIDNNQLRVAQDVTIEPIETSEVCEYSNGNLEIYTYDENFEALEADVYFSCLNEFCDVGKTKINEEGLAVYDGGVPRCVNGFLIVRSPGYMESEFLISTNKEFNIADVVLKKKVVLDLDLGDINYPVTLNFNSKSYSTSVSYPTVKTVELVEGNYNISAFAYSNSLITFPAQKKLQCFDKTNALGIIEEECFDVEIPEMKIDYAVIGGGKEEYFFLREKLNSATKLNIDVPIFEEPENLEELQENYAYTQNIELGVNLK